MTLNFVSDLHVKYIQELDTKKDSFEYWAGEHLRLNGVYWGLTALHLLGRGDALERNAVVEYVLSCQHANGAFGGHVGHDPHLLYTLSAVQILATLDALDRITKHQIATYVASLQQQDGSFAGDEYSEIDTRFSYCAISCLSLLGCLSSKYIDVDKATLFLHSCTNFDGGYGSVPGAESHSGQIFCCVGALAILNRLDLVETDKLGWWLAERQLKNGGLNGRPEKLEDVCYSWWVLSCLSILDRIHWINKDKLVDFILNAQDTETGGIADRPGDVADVFHTLFGVAGLSLLGYPGLDAVDPRYCMPVKVLQRLGLSEL
ncbi:terpenoid cyclases/protein prenyltransferase alpha-alpha toroid [Chytriomyces sp. MP71]|nr:terpenoid cyclases/protein prenyltransferase alpha-alpha toroid [Chytriomyces sp. MP71]